MATQAQPLVHIYVHERHFASIRLMSIGECTARGLLLVHGLVALAPRVLWTPSSVLFVLVGYR
jgi:hypothetical protein